MRDITWHVTTVKCKLFGKQMKFQACIEDHVTCIANENSTIGH